MMLLWAWTAPLLSAWQALAAGLWEAGSGGALVKRPLFRGPLAGSQHQDPSCDDVPYICVCIFFSRFEVLFYYRLSQGFEYSSLCYKMSPSYISTLSITSSRSSIKLTSIESVMPSSHLIFCCPLLLLPPIPPSIRLFPNESALRMRWPK